MFVRLPKGTTVFPSRSMARTPDNPKLYVIRDVWLDVPTDGPQVGFRTYV